MTSRSTNSSQKIFQFWKSVRVDWKVLLNFSTVEIVLTNALIFLSHYDIFLGQRTELWALRRSRKSSNLSELGLSISLARFSRDFKHTLGIFVFRCVCMAPIIDQFCAWHFVPKCLQSVGGEGQAWPLQCLNVERYLAVHYVCVLSLKYINCLSPQLAKRQET